MIKKITKTLFYFQGVSLESVQIVETFWIICLLVFGYVISGNFE